MDRKKSSETVRSLGENAYFAASNSAHGFHSYYDECFDRKEITRLFAIKGGPGTGKSRFMRDVAEWGERVGWSAEMIYCSSDPDSLDGVILTRNGEGIAVLDATAPHVYEPSRPGYREEIVNLGEFWNAELLRGHRDELDALNRRKKEAYRRGYRFLCGYEAMEENRRQLVAPFLREQAIAEFAAKLIHEVLANDEYYRNLIRENAKNWDFSRLAFMDLIIMQIALAEIVAFPTIPAAVSINEYLEIAKMYSTPRSHVYINGFLDALVKNLRAAGELMK